MYCAALTRHSRFPRRLLKLPVQELTFANRLALSRTWTRKYEQDSRWTTAKGVRDAVDASNSHTRRTTRKQGLRIWKHIVAPGTRQKLDSAQGFEVVSTVQDIRALQTRARSDKRFVSLVPTMGALHNGHLEIIREAASDCDDVIVSIYVNPTQFGANEDLDTYPRTLQEDLQQLRTLNQELFKRNRGIITAVFIPTTSEMYPTGLKNTSHVIVNPEITQILEGKARPTFFQGVTTVVMKLLNIVRPDRAYFGQKDIQQLVILRRMAEEFHLETKVHRISTQRQKDGLALSSRNAYLGVRRRAVAPVLIGALRAICARFNDPKRPRGRQTLMHAGLDFIKQKQDEQRALPPNKRVRFELDYLSLAHPSTLEELEVIGPEGAILSGAVIMLPLEDIQEGESLGTDRDAKPVRLIDNMLLGQVWTQNTDPHKPFGSF